MVAKVRSAINIHFHGADKPDVVFTDRGRGFFVPRTGKITLPYAAALREHALRAFMGQDASRQPGDLQDLMLHETAVAWISNRFVEGMGGVSRAVRGTIAICVPARQ